MAVALEIATLRLIFHHFYFLRLPGENNGALDLCTLDDGRTDGRVRAVVYEEHLAKNNCVTCLQIPRAIFSISVMLPIWQRK